MDETISEFDRAARTERTAEGVYAGEVLDGWDINGNANGGYLLAIAVGAMRDACGRADPISVSAHYLAPGRPGPVTVTTDVVKSGRQLTTMNGSLRGAEREIVRVLGTFGELDAFAGGYSHITGAPPELPPIEECSLRERMQGDARVSLMERISVRLNPEHGGFSHGVRNGRAVIEGWFEFVDGRPIDTLALMLVIDCFPPPVFNIDIPPGWVPTVELTAHVRGVPAPGPLRCRFHTEFVQHGFLQEDGEVWDSNGQLVAQSRQLALVPRI